MEKTNTMKIVLAFAVICILYMFIVFLFNFFKEEEFSGYIINSNLGGFYCQNTDCEWVGIEDINSSSTSFEIYQRNKSLGIYQLEYASKWNFYQQNEWQGIYGDFLAISNSLKYEVLSYQIENLTDEDYNSIRELIEGFSSSSASLNNDFAYVLDLDQNGVQDRILAVSNQTEEETGSEYFSSLIVNLNGKIHVIYEENTLKSNGFSLPYYSFMEAIKIGEEVKMILNKSYFNNAGSPSTILLSVSHNEILEEAVGQ